MRSWSNGLAVLTVVLAHGALAQDKPLELTPAGKVNLQDKLAANQVSFPQPMCTFPGGQCGAVHRDGRVAVPPRYDWVGRFADGRAAVRVAGLYGFVDEEGREVVKPQYRIAGDYKFGFVQVDVDGKSGILDREGRMVIEPKHGFIEAIAADRFRVSEQRRLGGESGGEDFTGVKISYPPGGGISVSSVSFEGAEGSTSGIIDASGNWVEPLGVKPRQFDKDDPSIRRSKRDKLWGLARDDGSWLVEPKFEELDALSDGLARVKIDGKFGFIDKSGRFAIEPVFDKAWWFIPAFGHTSASRDGAFGVIDKSGAWVFRRDYQQVHFAIKRGKDNSETVFGWHFKKADKWGFLDLDGHVVLDAAFDETISDYDGRLAGYKNKVLFYYRKDGSPLQPPNGQLIDAAMGGVPPFTLKIGDKFGFVDSDGRALTPVHFDATAWVAAGIKNVKLDGKWGRIGRDGAWLIEPKFDYLSSGLDLYVASIDGKRGLMRADGTWMIEPKFEAARVRDADTAFVTVAGATGVLRLKDQSWVISPRAGVMCDIGSAIMHQAEGKRTILSRAGEAWIDIGADRIGINLEIGLLTFLKHDKWGLVDTSGQVIVEPNYDDPIYFLQSLRGIAWARRDKSWCAIDRRGRPVPGIACTETNPVGGASGRFECRVEP